MYGIDVLFVDEKSTVTDFLNFNVSALTTAHCQKKLLWQTLRAATLVNLYRDK